MQGEGDTNTANFLNIFACNFLAFLFLDCFFKARKTPHSTSLCIYMEFIESYYSVQRHRTKTGFSRTILFKTYSAALILLNTFWSSCAPTMSRAEKDIPSVQKACRAKQHQTRTGMITPVFF